MNLNKFYETCPVYETPSFFLRLVRPDDAEALMACYGDPEVIPRLNADNCWGDFYCATLQDMENCIRAWLEEYRQRCYIRFAIVRRDTAVPIGTVEVCGELLRLDLAAAYDKAAVRDELLRLIVLRWSLDVSCGSWKLKAANTPDRIPQLSAFGFVPSETFRPGLGYYERPAPQPFSMERDVAYCGLACWVCSENETCPGCRQAGCRLKGWCKSWQCCTAKGLDGCWECPSFPCDYPMLHKLRVRTFSEFIAAHGWEALAQAIRKGAEHGLLYHYTGQLVGDYDLFQDADSLRRYLLNLLNT